MSYIEQAGIQVLTGYVAKETAVSVERCKAIFEANRDRIYSLAFWMTDNEMTAEEVSSRVFLKAFHNISAPNAQQIDRVLVNELREFAPIGNLTLNVTAPVTGSVRENTKRIHLERAVIALPATERLAFLLHDVEGYTHEQVGQAIGITAAESQSAVLQAKLKIRELVAEMI